MKLAHFGSLADRALIIVVGCANHTRPATTLDSSVRDLHALGHSVCWLETRAAQTMGWLNDTFERLLTPPIAALCCDRAVFGRLLPQLITLGILLMHPTRWDFLVRTLRRAPQHVAHDLRRLIRQPLTDRIDLYSHSAGGIVSARVASEPPVARMICFGYPFKHPKPPEEARRSAHLATLAKPLLIIQGDQDEYGSAQDAQRYNLSAKIRGISVNASHDYHPLDHHEYQRYWAQLNDFLNEAGNGEA